VHEGPQDVRQNFNPAPLVPGVIISDEPGLYREGMHGIRHENLLLVRPVGDNEFGSFLGFETLTLCHFDTSCLELSLMTADEIAWLNAYNAHVYDVLSPRLPAEVAAWLFEKTRPV
jgi:Xaa-Pro aminopeptidase